MVRVSSFAICLLALISLPTLAAPQKMPAQYVVGVAQDKQGQVWVATEAEGVWRCDAAGHWTQFTHLDGMGEDAATAVACDAQGRVWVGHCRRGVSVFNGKAWKNYDELTGPLGGHVFALAICPTDGDVWMATDRGLARYGQAQDSWTYFTRAGGLPDDPGQALAFDKTGTLYLGLAGGGLGIASASDGYKTWRVVSGPAHVPDAPSGSGLPSAQVNALLVAHDGSIYAGTTCGLAGSQDGGKTWHFLRGPDWFDKARDRIGGAAPELTGPAGELLSEDWVTCLAEDSTGALWIGHRRTGVERLNPVAGQHTPLPPLPPTNFVRAVLAPDGQNPWVGTYGKGLLQPAALPAGVPPPAAAPPLPSPAAAPDAAALTALAQDAAKGTTPLAAGTGAFLGDDWATQGDWVGRYGRQYAALCAMQGGGDHIYAEDLRYSVGYGIGPHYKGYDGVYTYIGKLFTLDKRLPYTPVRGSRRDAEVNDGSWDQGRYPASWEGPDLWATVTVPDGLHRVSLYLVNNDGHDGNNMRRDYTLELRPHTAAVADSQPSSDLASTRVSDFYNGVYEQFLVQGPGTFDFRIGRDYSECVKLQGVFFDRLTGTVPPDAPKPPSLDQPFLGLLLSPGPNGTVFVSNLDGAGPAGKAGIQPGDVILRAGGKPVTDAAGLTAQIGQLTPGTTFWVRVRRADHAGTLALPVVVGTKSFGDNSFPMALPLGGVTYAPPPSPALTSNASPALTAAQALWTALDAADAQAGGAARDSAERILAYRAAASANAPPSLLENWRWTLRLWTPDDHLKLARTMYLAWQAQLARTPSLAQRGSGQKRP